MAKPPTLTQRAIPRRIQVFQEIVTTEQSYVNSLQQLMRHFVLPLDPTHWRRSPITVADHATLFQSLVPLVVKKKGLFFSFFLFYFLFCYVSIYTTILRRIPIRTHIYHSDSKCSACIFGGTGSRVCHFISLILTHLFTHTTPHDILSPFAFLTPILGSPSIKPFWLT